MYGTAWPNGCAVLFAVCVSLSCRRPRYVLPACASRSSPFCARTKLLLEELVAQTESVSANDKMKENAEEKI